MSEDEYGRVELEGMAIPPEGRGNTVAAFIRSMAKYRAYWIERQGRSKDSVAHVFMPYWLAAAYAAEKVERLEDIGPRVERFLADLRRVGCEAALIGGA